jgi:hypothetical protein
MSKDPKYKRGLTDRMFVITSIFLLLFVIAVFYMMYVTLDLSPLQVLIPAVFAYSTIFAGMWVWKNTEEKKGIPKGNVPIGGIITDDPTKLKDAIFDTINTIEDITTPGETQDEVVDETIPDENN